MIQRSGRTILTSIRGSLLVIGFIATLAPWTVRNWQVFHVWQPLAPMYANMPEEFVPMGYWTWAASWVTDEEYVASVEWPLDLRGCEKIENRASMVS